MPRISVVIPHFNQLDELSKCLDSLDGQTMAREDFEVIVADNASPVSRSALDATVGDRARLVVVHERGAGPARNGGVDVASGDVLAFIDADCLAAPGWLDAGIVGLQGYDIIGGQVDVSV